MSKAVSGGGARGENVIRFDSGVESIGLIHQYDQIQDSDLEAFTI